MIFDDQLIFLQCFDTVGLVIWPVKIVPEITYNVSSGTLNPTHSLTNAYFGIFAILPTFAAHHSQQYKDRHVHESPAFIHGVRASVDEA